MDFFFKFLELGTMHTITTSTRWKKKIKSPNDWFEHTVILNHLFSPKHKSKKFKWTETNEWTHAKHQEQPNARVRKIKKMDGHPCD